MIKNNIGRLIASSVVILLPMLAGVLLWNTLPDTMSIHWGIDGKEDGTGTRAFAVFVLPLILLALHWLCVIVTALDHKNRAQSSKVFHMVLWIVPLISLFTSAILYAVAYGMTDDVTIWLPLILGLIFFVIGNYLPKCQRNRTIGIKVKWALASDDNWNATHRLGGKVWVVAGLVMPFCALLPTLWMMGTAFAIILLAALIPTVYSYGYYRRQLESGAITKESVMLTKNEKTVQFITLVLVFLILAAVGIIMFTGTITVTYSPTAFTVDATYWSKLTVEYDAIDNIEYRDREASGTRTSGFGSAQLLLGTFENEEFGSYTRYTYTDSESCVILHIGDNVLVLSGKTPTDTQSIYNKLSERWVSFAGN